MRAHIRKVIQLCGLALAILIMGIISVVAGSVCLEMRRAFVRFGVYLIVSSLGLFTICTALLFVLVIVHIITQQDNLLPI